VVGRGGANYTGRLNSVFNPNSIDESAFGLHLQHLNIIPGNEDPPVTGNFGSPPASPLPSRRA
jgi:hypothetical protein